MHMRSLSSSCLALLLVLAQTGFAQTVVKIDGYVHDHHGRPLQGANVVVVGTALGAATDHTGYFAIEDLFAGEYQVEATYLGFQSQRREGVTVSKESTTTLYFRLEPAVIPLAEVVVQASQRSAETDVFDETVTQQDIRSSAAQTVGEILLNIAGVDIVQKGGGSGETSVSIHGSQANQVLVLMDGMPLNDPMTGAVDLSQISLASVREIRIHKGGGSGRFGSGALGGVIEIISQQQFIEAVRINAKRGAFGRFGVQPSLSGKIGDFGFFLNADYLTEKGNYPYRFRQLDGATVEATRLNADFTSQQLFAKVGWMGERRRLHVQTSYFHSTRGLPGLVFAWTPFANADTRRLMLLADLQVETGAFFHKVQLSRYANRSEFINAPPPDAPLRYRTVPAYHTANRLVSYLASAESSWLGAGPHPVTLSASVKVDDFADDNIGDASAGPIRRANNVSVRVGLSHTFVLPRPPYLSSMLLKTAVRMDKFHFSNAELKRNDRQISPLLGLTAEFADDWPLTLQANWGRSFREPTFADLFFQDFRVRGNPDLLPEKSWDFDAGLKIGSSDRFEISALYFRHRIDNLIQWELGSFATWQPFNTDALLEGVEVGLRGGVWGETLQFHLDHVLLNAENRSGRRTTQGRDLTYRPRHVTKAGLRASVEEFTVRVDSRVSGTRFVTPSNTVRLNGYWVTDANLSFKMMLSKVEMETTFSVFNLFNERYEVVEGGPMPGRHWHAGVAVRY